jgi:drug/metabolite transporter (DMT)-like permease
LFLGSCPNFNFEYKEKGEADVLLLDVSNSLNYVWTDHFSPDAVIPPQSSSPQPTIATSTVATTITTSIIITSAITTSTQYNDKNNTRIIVGVVVGVLGIICIIPFGIFFFIKRRNILLHENALPIPGNSENVPSG